jgi:hypothetical protein
MPASASALSIELAEEIASRDTEGVKTRTVSDVLAGCLPIFLMSGQRERAEAIGRRLVEIGARTNDALSVLRGRMPALYAATLDGRLEDAVSQADGLIQIGESRGSADGARVIAILGGFALVHLGRPGEAIERHDFYSRGTTIAPLGTRAWLLAHAGQFEEARTLLSDLAGPRLAHPERIHAITLRALILLLDTAVLLGDKAVAKELLPHLNRYADYAFVHQLAGAFTPARVLAGAAALTGNASAARELYNLALTRTAQIRFRPETALAHLGMAELLFEHYPDEAAQAQEHLDFAIAEFREMKMQPSLERALSHRGLLKA